MKKIIKLSLIVIILLNGGCSTTTFIKPTIQKPAIRYSSIDFSTNSGNIKL